MNILIRRATAFFLAAALLSAGIQVQGASASGPRINSPAVEAAGAAPLDLVPISPDAPTAAQFYDGMIQYSTITNCVSIIQGAPYQEYGAGTFVGFLADPDNGLPAPNTVYYMHIVVGGLGNACSGMRAYLDLGLPPNTSLAIDGTNKVYCLYDGAQIPAAECTQVPLASSINPGFYNFPSIDSAHAYLWPLPQGHILEIQIPVRSTTTLTNSPMVGKVWVLDGNSSPWLRPQQGVYVFSSQPAILYPSPSTTLATATGAATDKFGRINFGIHFCVERAKMAHADHTHGEFFHGLFRLNF